MTIQHILITKVNTYVHDVDEGNRKILLAQKQPLANSKISEESMCAPQVPSTSAGVWP